MKKFLAAVVLPILMCIPTIAQVAINSDGSVPAPSAMLDVKSTTKGALLTRMSFAQRNAIANPAEGLTVICSNCNPDGGGCISIYLGGHWLNLAGSCDLPVSPPEGIHVQLNNMITWNWNAVPIATGYKWSSTNNYAAATNMGMNTSWSETALTTGISYTRYVWAYNACGYSEPTILQGQALTCGYSFTKTHTAGSVAPVAKTVTYGTVTSIPGETSKCWITRNLGATMQPNTVSDNSEEAAGWYWQFNRKQGYKHDGTTLTPAWTITSISEDFDWEPAKDPCTLLLGNTWRIPTQTEWTNVDAAGNWTNWNGPWSSGLQIHAAGYLNYNDGSLNFRGAAGNYWSRTQHGEPNGGYLNFYNSISYMNFNIKTNGLSIRCLRD